MKTMANYHTSFKSQDRSVTCWARPLREKGGSVKAAAL